jgi:hypothetical protein
MSKEKTQSQEIAAPQSREEIINKLIMAGDLSGLTKLEQLWYYNQRCERLGLDPLTKPFDLMEVEDKKGSVKKVLYANKTCAEQLRAIHKINLRIVSAEEVSGLISVTVEAALPNGRTDTDIGSVWVKALVGKELANAHMKAVTKAKRRVTFSILGEGDLALDPDDFEPGRVAHSESLTVSNKGSGLDQWNVPRALALEVINACKHVGEAGITEAEWRAKLPEGITSRKELTPVQAAVFLEDLRALYIGKKKGEATNA